MLTLRALHILVQVWSRSAGVLGLGLLEELLAPAMRRASCAMNSATFPHNFKPRDLRSPSTTLYHHLNSCHLIPIWLIRLAPVVTRTKQSTLARLGWRSRCPRPLEQWESAISAAPHDLASHLLLCLLLSIENFAILNLLATDPLH